MADVGTGTTVSFSVSAISLEFLDVQGLSAEIASIDSSHMGTTAWRSKIPSDLKDAGQVVFTVHWTGGESVFAEIGTVQTVTIDWGGSGNTTALASSFISNVEPGASLEEKMTADITVTVGGTVTGG